MQLDAAQILRQTIASTKFDAAPSSAQKADTPVDEVLATAWKWQKKLREDGVM